MLRRSFCVFAASASATQAAASDTRLTTLHKLLVGEVQLRNNTPLKACYIEHNFGPNWHTDVLAYARTLQASDRALIERQVARVQLTRYTTRELSLYCGNGPENIDADASEANIAQARAYIASHGEQQFMQYVSAEAKNANWSDSDLQRFIHAATKTPK